MKMLILFSVPFIVGVFAYAVPRLIDNNLSTLLVFAGSYLVAIIVLHLLSGIVEHRIVGVEWVVVLAIIGFLAPHGFDYAVSPKERIPFALVPLFLALCTHAFLEGAMVAHPLSKTLGGGDTILLGILLHRAPVAFALVAMLSRRALSKKYAIGCLFIFSTAAPLGWWVSEYVAKVGLISERLTPFLYAIMGGSFLQLCLANLKNQSRPLKRKKIAIAILGLLTGTFIELVY